MTSIWTQIALVFGLALIAAIFASRYRVSTALAEIIVGMIARTLFTFTIGAEIFAVQEPPSRAEQGIWPSKA